MEHDKKTQELIVAAERIIDDFEEYGEVLQVDDDYEYGPDSGIGMLKRAYNAIVKRKPRRREESPGKYFKKLAHGHSDFAP